MITGFNTDIIYNGVTYHVQTEDKGVETPLILSLVYDRGTILASKRSPYDDLLGGGVPLDERELSERLQKQHKLICAAIKAGRIDDLKRMTMKESASKKKGLVAQKEIRVIAAAPAAPELTKEEIPLPDLLAGNLRPPGARPMPPVSASSKNRIETTRPHAPTTDEAVIEIPISILTEDAGPIIEAVEIVEEEVILPLDAVEIITDFTKSEQQQRGGEQNKLAVELLNAPTFKGGERKTLSILVHRGREESGIGGAHVMVKVLGTSFRPLIFHAKTDSNGVAIIHLQLPQFKTGRAAILVRAASDGEETELRRLIQHN